MTEHELPCGHSKLSVYGLAATGDECAVCLERERDGYRDDLRTRTAQLTAANAELATLRAEREQLADDNELLDTQRSLAEARLAVAVEALEFYAESEHWRYSGPTPRFPSTIKQDGGKRARAALTSAVTLPVRAESDAADAVARVKALPKSGYDGAIREALLGTSGAEGGG